MKVSAYLNLDDKEYSMKLPEFGRFIAISIEHLSAFAA